MTEHEHRYAAYGSLVVQHPRARVNLSREIKQAAEEERLQMELDLIRYRYRTDYLTLMMPTLIPLVVFVTYFGLRFLQIWLISRGH